MGIRFERDSRKATNGPLIFFSILQDEAFEEEIRSAFLSGLSFYAYRFPNDSMFSYGSSEGYVEGVGTPGFTIGMFNKDNPFITIPYAGTKKVSEPHSFYSMPSKSTLYEDYSNEVTKIIEDLKGEHNSKVVAARVVVKENPDFDIAENFYELCRRFPESFVFCFSTPATGCWIGASPELLLTGKPGILESMALAGTRQKGDNEPWDKKNIEEQSIVKNYISEILLQNGLIPIEEETYTKKAGTIEHICTPIKANSSGDIDLTKLLKDLSPTPALCGFPKEFAYKEIQKLENFERGCYGGFCGPFHSTDDFHFNVVLRCAAINEKRQCLYAGGGITSRSNINQEWEETNLKLNNIF